jgi:drug/metabolite transporter (DMT)-like permease
MLACGSMFGFFYGLSAMPLVNALTLGFTAPLMLTALSASVLGEHVGWRRWAAVLVGFAGVLVVLRPGSGFLTPASVAVLCAAFCYACLALTARHLGRTESSFSLSVYVIAGPLLVSAALLSNNAWTAVDTRGWLLFLVAGSCSVIAWIGIIGGYRRASPAILAPFEYTALVGGTLAGYLIWGEIPDRYVLAGAIIIVTSGLYVGYREIQLPARQQNGNLVAQTTYTSPASSPATSAAVTPSAAAVRLKKSISRTLTLWSLRITSASAWITSARCSGFIFFCTVARYFCRLASAYKSARAATRISATRNS